MTINHFTVSTDNFILVSQYSNSKRINAFGMKNQGDHYHSLKNEFSIGVWHVKHKK